MTTIWGYSGAGKTLLAANLACDALLAREKVMCLSDRPAVVQATVERLIPNDDDITGRLVLFDVQDFPRQSSAIRQLPFALATGAGAGLAGITAMDINPGDVDTVTMGIQRPATIIIDEFTRPYARQVLKPAGPGDVHKELASQLGLLRWLCRHHHVKVIVTASARATVLDERDETEAIMADVPAARSAVEFFSDSTVQVSWTATPGERRVRVATASPGSKDTPLPCNVDDLCTPFPRA